VTEAEALEERRRRRLWLLGASAAFAAVLIAMAIALSRADEETGSTTGPPEGVAEAMALYRGIPQSGPELGRKESRVTVVEFADLQCPFCGEYSRDVMPTLVSRYVRTGKVKIGLRILDFVGPDSTDAARMAAAAGRQGKLFEFVDLVYRNQGGENQGWVNDAYLRRVGGAVGLDVERAFAQREGPAVTNQLDAAKDEAERVAVKGTPTVLIFTAGSSDPKRLEADEVSVGEVTEAIDDALAGG
jgi:protein-disulfide isomerase